MGSPVCKHTSGSDDNQRHLRAILVNDSASFPLGAFNNKRLKSTYLNVSPCRTASPLSSTVFFLRLSVLPEKMSSVIDLELPRYSASVPTPDYSFEPGCGERTLEETPRSLRPVTESTYIKQSGKTTVVLHNQEENARMPSYGREGAISGSVLFDSSDNICEVGLEV